MRAACALALLAAVAGPPASAAAESGAALAAAVPELAHALAPVDRELAEMDTLLASAYFRTALALAKATRGLLGTLGEGSEVDARRARLEVMAATAEVALGRDAAARRSLGRARRADPTLMLDESRTSPRLLALLPDAGAGVEELRP